MSFIVHLVAREARLILSIADAVPRRRPLWVARALLVTLAPLAFDGCFSVGVSRSALPQPGKTGALEISIFEKGSDRDAAAILTTPVLSELVRVEKGSPAVVARSMAAHWRVERLPPGRYRLLLRKGLDERGNVVSLRREGRKSFDVRAGERTRLAVVLEKTPSAWIALAAVTLVALAILSIEFAKDIPLPDLPVPPVSVVLAAEVVLDSVPIGDSGSAGPGPEIAEAFPAPGSVVAAPRVTVSFLLTAPLDPDEIERGAVQALGSESGELHGVVSFRPDEQLLCFTPDRDFVPGDTVTVTVDLSKIRGAGGARSEGLFSTRFQVAGGQEKDEAEAEEDD
ncbi:MAG TPA: hypothetical protein VGR00_03640 [Thermoanaerobaculia bacterium]|nr:hypothetical protein [Thermoanaerobaculia bacterium]